MLVSNWETLPAEIYVNIFQNLMNDDRLNAAQVCKTWNRCMKSPQLWYTVEVDFQKGLCDINLRDIAKNYGEFFRHLHIKCHQQAADNCTNSGNFVQVLARKERLKLQEFKLEFCEQNPFFFSGGRIYLENLQDFFNTKSLCYITKIDLSKFPIAITDDFLKTITKCHASYLEVFNIQNNTLVYQISRATLVAFVKKARRLQSLYVQAGCFCSDVLRAFGNADRAEVQFISLLFTSDAKHSRFVTDEEWLMIKKKSPNLKIEVWFNHTYPLHLTYRVLVPEAPVSILKLCLYSTVIDHINLVSSIYSTILESLCIYTTTSRELDNAVLNLVKECKKLTVLHVVCKMNDDVVKEIFQMKQLKEYTLTTDE